MDIPEAVVDLQNLEIPAYRRIWKPFMEKYDCQIICEVGVFEGTNFDLMIAHSPIQAIAVDSWKNDGVVSRNDEGSTQKELNIRYINFKTRMANKKFVKVYREYSFKAVKHFPDNYFDLVYIDADHSYEGCLEDIKNWYPKVKNGKFLTGDDYRRGDTSKTKVKIGVKQAVQEFARENNLKFYELPNHGWAIIKP
jgi:hypothetical protein